MSNNYNIYLINLDSDNNRIQDALDRKMFTENVKSANIRLEESQKKRQQRKALIDDFINHPYKAMEAYFH